jgi:hypothetical protein
MQTIVLFCLFGGSLSSSEGVLFSVTLICAVKSARDELSDSACF